jgi:hypothetical protein
VCPLKLLGLLCLGPGRVVVPRFPEHCPSVVSWPILCRHLWSLAAQGLKDCKVRAAGLTAVGRGLVHNV